LNVSRKGKIESFKAVVDHGLYDLFGWRLSQSVVTLPVIRIGKSVIRVTNLPVVHLGRPISGVDVGMESPR